MIQKSPGGSYYPYGYKGGELHCLKYGSYYADAAALLQTMRAEEAFVLSKKRILPFWVDLYHTRWTENALEELLVSLERIQHRISKLALVGLRYRDRIRLKRIQKRLGIKLVLQVHFFRDPEVAKSWLVGEA
ncbi:hypothetical protein ACTHPF_02625 [Paenibacillus sp. SAF-054]|uniref:hypothetical protein n=1 Tax=unclassified Paenibacillus TaxID=185978 RepID=UPI003F80B875